MVLQAVRVPDSPLGLHVNAALQLPWQWWVTLRIYVPCSPWGKFLGASWTLYYPTAQSRVQMPLPKAAVIPEKKMRYKPRLGLSQHLWNKRCFIFLKNIAVINKKAVHLTATHFSFIYLQIARIKKAGHITLSQILPARL